jgi:hypothetical protein
LKALTARAEKAEAFASKFQGKVLGDSVRGAALKAGALPEATDDIILRAKGVFSLNEEGEAVAVDESGQVILGKDGKGSFNGLSPLRIRIWVRSSAMCLSFAISSQLLLVSISVARPLASDVSDFAAPN